VLHHHERWDGCGYPHGLAGEAIPVEARILAVADAYDAMTSDRPYRPAMSHADAIRELERCAGTQFDPALAEVFLSIAR
jgi:HD-GYP domain-containing protein (c-di-GMP phosphodiesterase class II)